MQSLIWQYSAVTFLHYYKDGKGIGREGEGSFALNSYPLLDLPVLIVFKLNYYTAVNVLPADWNHIMQADSITLNYEESVTWPICVFLWISTPLGVYVYEEMLV